MIRETTLGHALLLGAVALLVGLLVWSRHERAMSLNRRNGSLLDSVGLSLLGIVIVFLVVCVLAVVGAGVNAITQAEPAARVASMMLVAAFSVLVGGSVLVLLPAVPYAVMGGLVFWLVEVIRGYRVGRCDESA